MHSRLSNMQIALLTQDAVFSNVLLLQLKINFMKKKSEKKLHLGKIKIASLNQTKGHAAIITIVGCSTGCTNLSQGAPICSEDSCRF